MLEYDFHTFSVTKMIQLKESEISLALLLKDESGFKIYLSF